MTDTQSEEYMSNYEKELELLKAKLEILDRIYVAGDSTKTYLNVAQEINLLLNLLDPNLN
jgi:peptidase E